MSVPTLLVGLGGAGLTIVKKVYNRATPEQRKNIAFVVFDTDVNELSAISESKMNIHAIQISATMTVGEYLRYDDNARNKWFPVNNVLNTKVLTEGAGQVRAISRLAFNTALMQGKMAPLDTAISELYKLRGNTLSQAPRVIITGSLCGGTGSGLALPVSMYIRNYLQTKVQQGSAIIRGFFLLPEVFFHVITGNSERNNLRCNAYAAVREIDAFMRKADSHLPEQYDLHFTIPRVNSKIEDEYTGRPMDFCFLFDAQNIDGGRLQSFEAYRQHAANCIYSMAIAPTSSKSNSSEDNVIRDIVWEQGRNRFAGAGTSLLQYPTEEIKRYLGLCWTRESISQEWTEIDQRFKAEEELNKARRKAGFTEQTIDRGAHYINVMKEEVAQYKPFNKAIYDMCIQEKSQESDDGKGTVKTTIKQATWEAYVEELLAYIDSSISEARSEVRDIEQDMTKKQATIENTNADLQKLFSQWFRTLVDYRDSEIKTVEELSRNLIFTLFRDTKDYTRTENKFRLEYWLRKGHDPEKFFHPSAVRFMMYNILTLLRDQLAENQSDANDERSILREFEVKAYDDPETTDRVESQGEFMKQSEFGAKGIGGLLKRGTIEENKEKLIKNFKKAMQSAFSYWKHGVYTNVLEKAIQYIEQMSRVFEAFYDSLQSNYVTVDEDIKLMERSFEITDGVPLRYVCADKQCLQELAKEAYSPNDSLDLPGHLCAKIYTELRKRAMDRIQRELMMVGRENDDEDSRKKDIATDRFCSYLFNETIVKHQERKMEEQYGGTIHMDVLEALEREAKYKLPEEEREDKEKILKYMTSVLASTRKLSEPFIESPGDKEDRTFSVCTYSDKLIDPDKAIPGRKEFVEKYLAGNGMPSKDIETDVILFYKAVYDLRAMDLGKFAPPEKTETTDRQAGEYYKAYHELISELHPDPRKSRAITPHLDRWWHVITKMPELSDESQQMQEEAIARAFMWGMLGKYVLFCKDETDRQYYAPARYKLNLKREECEKLMVSNGTTCDKLFEVLDAFTIYPRMVALVNAKADEKIDNDLVNKVPLKDSYLYEQLREFTADEIPIAKEEPSEEAGEGEKKTVVNANAPRSIFELPLLMKRSVPPEDYNQRTIDELMDVIFDELYTYHKRFCAEKEVIIEYSTLLLEQTKLLVENVAEEDKKYPELKLIKDPLLDEVLEQIEGEMQNRGLPAHAAQVTKLRQKRARYGNLSADAFVK